MITRQMQKGPTEFHTQAMLRFSVLGSGSAGNAAIIECGNTRLLIDAGLSAKQLVLRMQSQGIDPDSITSILLTHEHGDHIKGLDVFLKNRKIPVFTTALTREAFEHRLQRCKPDWHLFNPGQSFQIENFSIQTFPVQHDAAEPVGYRFKVAGHIVAFLSDLGFASEAVKSALKHASLVYLESNYDDEMLAQDTRRPYSTIQRISSRHGHLSNKQAADLLEEVACQRLQSLVIGHLSSDCNCSEIAVDFIQKRLASKQLHPQLLCSSQLEPTPWVTLSPATQSSALDPSLLMDQVEFSF